MSRWCVAVMMYQRYAYNNNNINLLWALFAKDKNSAASERRKSRTMGNRTQREENQDSDDGD